MRFHPLLSDPTAVLIMRLPVPDAPAWPDFERCAEQALECLQIDVQGHKVAIKPNVTAGEHFADPDLGIGTHPGFIAGMVKHLRDHGARPGGIYVVEDPRDTDDNKPRHWKGTGYPEMAQQTGAKLRCPTSYTCVRKTVPHPHAHATRNVSRLAVDPDTVLINVPKLKTHNLAITTLCMKNLMGLDNVFDRHYCAQALKELSAEWKMSEHSRHEWMTAEMHERWQEGLARRLVDLAQVIQPHLNIVEGVVGRDGTGFRRGHNYALGIVAAGINVVAVDSVVSYLMGFDPCELIYLKMAAAAGLGDNDISRLRIYVAEHGEMIPCRDVEALRVQPRFEVIRSTNE